MQSMATVTSIQSPRKRTCRSPLPREAAGVLKSRDQRLLVFSLDDLFATVITVRTDVMTQVHLPRGGLHRHRRRRQVIVRAVHAALGGGLLVLLDCHVNS